MLATIFGKYILGKLKINLFEKIMLYVTNYKDTKQYYHKKRLASSEHNNRKQNLKFSEHYTF